MTNYFRKPDALVDAVRSILSGQPVQEKMDPVDQKALKGKHSDRKDKDIDNDGDVDSSDEYLHKRRKAVSKAMKEGVVLGEAKTDAYHKEMLKALGKSKLPKGHQYTSAVASNGDFVVYDGGKRIVGRLKKGEHSIKEDVEDDPANTQHLCAKNVVHESWGEGSCIPTMHADPDEEGNVAWYDVMFDHGIEEQVSIEELKVTKAESHIHSSKKKIKKSKDEYEDDDDDSDEDEKNGKKKKVSGKKDDVDVEPEMDDTKMVTEKEMTPAQEKKREEIVLSMKKEMPRFKKKYGDRAKDVMYATATKMAMKEGFELGIEKSDLIEEVELDEAFKRGDKVTVKVAKSSDIEIQQLSKKFGDTVSGVVMGQSGKILMVKTDKGQINPPVKDVMKEEVELDEAKIAKKVPAKDGGHFVVLHRDTSGMRGTQDKFHMRHLKNGKVKDYGTHPSMDGALKFAKNRGIIEEVELDEAISASSAYALVIQQKDGSREIVAKGSKEKMKSAAKKYGGLKQGKVFISLTGKKVGDKILGIGEETELDEAKSGTGYDLYHKDFSSAMQHAYDHAKKKHGITINPKEIDDKVATGPAKPKEGKTNSYRLKGDKGAIQVQVYNKGGSKPFELNMYKEEVELDEGRGRPRKDGTTGGSEDRENIQMQLRKSVSLRGLKDVEFADGNKVKVPAKVAQGVMSKINSIKDAKQKQNAVQHIAKSHKHMMDFHKGDYKDADAKRQDILKLK